MPHKSASNNKKEEPKKEQFKFAAALLTTFATILYIVYIYFQNAAITNIGLHRIVRSTLELGLVSSSVFIIYVLIRGVSAIYAINSSQKERLENIASWWYSISFLVIFIQLLKMIIYNIHPELNWMQVFPLIAKVILVLTIFYYVFFLLNIFKKAWFEKAIKKDIQKTILKSIFKKFLKPLLISLLILVVFIPFSQYFFEATPDYFLLGNVNYDMGNIYYKNDTQIPVSIKITGPNYGLNLFLYKIVSRSTSIDNQPLIDNISLEHPEYGTLAGWMGQDITHNNQTRPRIAFGNNTNSTLFAIVVDKQSYNVFIDTTNLNEGYYLLVIQRDNKNYTKGFYLSNNSKT